MNIFKKYKTIILIFVALTALFFASRLYNIMSLPIFTDEAIYVRWSQIARYDASWRFISLTDGKQPSFVWFTMIMMRFIEDPLLAGRLVSVVSGFITMIGLFFVGYELFKNKWIGTASSMIYLVFPMALVYDRMALYDSLVGMFMIWAFYFSVLLVRYIRLDVALILGMVIGGGVLTKTSAFFSMPLLLFTAVIFDFRHKLWRRRLIKLVGLSLLSISMGFVFYSILRLSPFFHIIADKNSLFAYPFSEWIKHPVEFFASNLRGLFDWLLSYFTFPLSIFIIGAFLVKTKFNKEQLVIIAKVFVPFFLILGILNAAAGLKIIDIEPPLYHPYIFLIFLLVSLYISFSKRYEFFKEKFILLLWFTAPFIYLAFFGRTIYPRFIFFMVIFLIPLIAHFIFSTAQSVQKKIFFTLLVITFAAAIRTDYLILNNFSRAPIPRPDVEQYSNSWPAGGGIKEIIEFLNDEASKGKIYVASEGTFGSLSTNAVEIYLGENKNVEKRGIWPLPIQIPQDLLEKSKHMPVYFIFNETQYPPPPVDWPLKFIAKYKKGISEKWYVSLYQVEKK